MTVTGGLRNNAVQAGDGLARQKGHVLGSTEWRGCASIQYAGGSRRRALDPPMAQASVARAPDDQAEWRATPSTGFIFGEAAVPRRARAASQTARDIPQWGLAAVDDAQLRTA